MPTSAGGSGILIALISLPYLWTKDMLFYWQASYATVVLLLAWGVFAWRALRRADLDETSAVTSSAASIPLKPAEA